MKDTRSVDLSMYVAKSNELIQKSKYSLSLLSQQLIDFAISKIKPGDTADTWYDFTVKEFCHSSNIHDTQGTTYNQIRTTMKEELRDKSWWILTEDGKYTTISWFSKVKAEKGDGTIEFKFDEDVHRYLFDLLDPDKSGNFTTYRLKDTYAFKSKYTYALYQLFKSYTLRNYFSRHDEKIVDFDVDRLKEQLGCEKYRYADFHRRVLNPSVQEMNEKCQEFNVMLEELHEGKRVVKVQFILTRPRAREILDKEALTRELLYKDKAKKRVKKEKKEAL